MIIWFSFHRIALLFSGVTFNLSVWVRLENQVGIAILYQLNQSIAVKYNKQFKSDSQRVAILLRFEICVYGVMV